MSHLANARESDTQRAMATKRQAFMLMSEALAILDDESIELIAAARLQAAIDTLGLAEPAVDTSKQLSDPHARQIVEQLICAGSGRLPQMIDMLGIPAYITDADGQVTHWNSECVVFAGRQPKLGKDRWCVTWKLYTSIGEVLPHDRCPMALAIREQRPVLGEIAIAERPNGQRVTFRPYPTPLFDEQGKLTGAVNILVDVSKEQQRELANQAAICRQIANSVDDTKISAILDNLAETYEATAASLS